jgi:hypothetical protein
MRIRPSTRIVVAACTMVLGLLAGTSSAQAAYDGFYGVNAQGLFALPSSSWGTNLSQMSSGGLQVVRRDAPWVVAEPRAPANGVHTYNWTSFDTQVTAYAQHHLRWLPIIDYSTSWSGQVPGDVMSGVARVQDYRAYAAAFARRYGRGGTFWSAHPELPQLPVTKYEIWNEPNLWTFWHPQEDAPERYADLYLATRSTLHGVDPNANVMVAGLALPGGALPTDFVQRMYRHRPDLRGNIDSFGLHPYMWTLDGVLLRIGQFRELLTSLGSGSVPLEITEVGWPVRTSTEEANRAASLSGLADLLPRSDCNVHSLIPHTWVTSESNSSDNEDWFGIENRNGTPKPSATAYLSTAKQMRASQSSPQVRLCHPANSDLSAAASAAAASAARGPVLHLRVVKRARRRRLVVYARCPNGCGLRLRVMSRPRRGSSGLHRRVLARRSLRFSSRRRAVRFRIRRGRRSVELRALAVGRNGRATRRIRVVRLRAASNR